MQYDAKWKPLKTKTAVVWWIYTLGEGERSETEGGLSIRGMYERERAAAAVVAVSYTHLTLPTNREV